MASLQAVLLSSLVPDLRHKWKGKVASLSADVIVQPATRESYYLARIAITDEARLRRERSLVPGMPVEVFLATTGRRTALQYLLGPLTEQLSHAMRES